MLRAATRVFKSRPPEPQTRPNWIVTQSDLDEQAEREAAGSSAAATAERLVSECHDEPDTASHRRRAVRFVVNGLGVVTESDTISPSDILWCIGGSPAQTRNGGHILVRVRSDGSPVRVYGPELSGQPEPVYPGYQFEAWDANDSRLHWYSVNGHDFVGLDYAVAPAILVRLVGEDPAASALHFVDKTPVGTNDRLPVRVSNREFVTLPRE